MIEVRNLTKRYGNTLAVQDISFTVKPGHIYGFLGQNGAGKSTTMNIITGCLAATSGSVQIGGHDIYKESVEAKRQIGYLPEIPPLYPDMTPEEYLSFVAEAKGVAFDRVEQEVSRVMEKTALSSVKDRLIKNLSKGYKQRVGIAQALLGDPAIIILDEPTVGLDPLQILEIRALIRDLGEDHTVILSSHILSEISAVCDYLIILSHGRIVADDTVANLTAAVEGQRIVTLEARGDIPTVDRILARLEKALHVTVSPGLNGCTHAAVETAAEEDLRDEIFRLFAKADVPIVEMAVNDLSLEDVFLRLTEEKLPSAEIPDESPDEPTESEAEAAKDETPAPSDDDDYTPLFGGRE